MAFSGANYGTHIHVQKKKNYTKNRQDLEVIKYYDSNDW